MSERRYSRAKANANRVSFSGREVMPVPFTFTQPLQDGQEFAFFRVVGRDIYCDGLDIFIDRPAGDAALKMTVALYTGDNTLVTPSISVIQGSQLQFLKKFRPALGMISGSTWKARITLEGSVSAYYPQGITLTYLNRYANGPVIPTYRSGRFTEDGVGFDVVSETQVP